MYAIVETGGKQYRVAPGDQIQVEKLPGDVGAEVELDGVVAVSNDDGEMLTGAAVGSAKIMGTISAHGRGKKRTVFKFKRRKHYRRKQGHRQDYTEIKVGDIVV